MEDEIWWNNVNKVGVLFKIRGKILLKGSEINDEEKIIWVFISWADALIKNWYELF